MKNLFLQVVTIIGQIVRKLYQDLQKKNLPAKNPDSCKNDLH